METKDKPRFRLLLREMAENSTLHGLPKIFGAKQAYMKIFWTVVFIATTGYLIFQLANLFESYYSWPIKTAVTLKHNPLQFPAVSFCNMNPIKRSYINQTSEAVMAILRPDLVKRNSSNTEWTEDDPLFNTTDYGDDLNKNYTGSRYDDSDEDSYWNFDSYTYDYNYDNYYDDYNTDPSSELDNQLIKELLSYDNNESPREKWIGRIEAFKHAFMNESSEKREKLGHSIQDMLVSCSYNARKCFYNNFTLFQSSEYGNCFTLESSDYFSRKPGPLNGLWLTLNLEILEYITSFVIGYGVKLLIHQPGTVVFPTVEGIVLSPGHETTIALRMVKVERLGEPYGECSVGEDFQKAFGIHYTIPACIKLCKQHWVVKMCKCLPTQLEFEVDHDNEMDEAKTHKVRECESGNVAGMKELVYEKTISTRPWPNDDYLKYALVRRLCWNKNLTYLEEFCGRYQNDSKEADVTVARDNFLRTVIYFEDINYEAITESPLYDEFQFLANIGGTLGLFLGASVLSAVEIIQLFIEIFIYLRGRFCQKVLKISDGKKMQVKPLPDKVNEDAVKEFDF
ncbi:amiloride-sensitive sodium channel subunit beta-2-like [Mizuhopecten yessoensis]|uniref:amiloride-sensitive sodium channel subunit beta-2-like n=1 Tax=Mizuhopecten yessoensis TaxID=6573 RepID=UPI000B45D445|nr:amiloride-sensitive sodium channel subunit beta-2-like [Mizuhopecten yessoensis]